MNAITHKIIFLTLTLLLIASTFIGIPLNGGDKRWLYINYLFRDFVNGHSIIDYTSLHILTLLWTFILYLMPLFVFSSHRKKIVLLVPLVYLILTCLSMPLIIFLYIPFVLIWIILVLFVSKRSLKNFS